MQAISTTLKTALKTGEELVRISVDLLSGNISDITEDDILAMELKRESVNGDSLEIGNANAHELLITLDRAGGKFDGIAFDGAKLYVEIGARTARGTEYMPLGYFTVDGHTNGDGEIELSALDRMVWFDTQADYSGIAFPCTPETLLRAACTACGVNAGRLSTEGLPNANYSIKERPTEACSWRQIIMWCCQIMGVNATIDAGGYLIVKWYTQTNERITAEDRFDHHIFENNVVIKGISVVDEAEDTEYLAGEQTGARITIEGNDLITHDFDTVAANIYNALGGFTYRPFDTECVIMPYFAPLDMAVYIDADGTEIPVCITNLHYILNDRMDIEGAGESETTSGYATLNPFTDRERSIITAVTNKTQESMREELSERTTALLQMNETISNALGLYTIEHTESDGSTQMYFANAPTLEEASLIYVFNAGGFAWTDEWGGSNKDTVWHYGITNDGNAILNYLYVNKLDASYINVGSIVGAINESTGDRELTISADHIDVSGKSLSVTLQNYVTNDDLDSTLESELKSYITSEELSLTLTSYATKDDLDEYAKTSDLDIYITSEELSATVSDYALKTDGQATTFGYTLTANGFELTANNNRVFYANATGLTLAGNITAESGKIAGLKISAEQRYNDQGELLGTLRAMRNPSDTFHIEIEEDSSGNATSTEVLITDLLCDNIKAKNSPNQIDLCFSEAAVSITATVSLNSWSSEPLVGNIRTYSYNLRFSFSGTVLSDKTVTLMFPGAPLLSQYNNITIPAGTSGTYSTTIEIMGSTPGDYDADNYNPPVIFSETNTNSISFSSIDQDEAAVKITGKVVPNANQSQDFGSTTRTWRNGYFKNLYLDGREVFTPRITSETSVEIRNLPSTTLITSQGPYGDIVGYGTVRLFNFGTIGIATLTYAGALSIDNWYCMSVSVLDEIYSVQATPRAARNANLNGNTVAAPLAVFIFGSYVYIGCDEYQADYGFELLIIGKLSN